MRRIRNVLIVTLAGAGVLVAALLVLAGLNETVRTGDRDAGGRANFSLVNDRGGMYFWLSACDDEKDGFGVRAYASLHKGVKRNTVVNREGTGICTGGPVRIRKGEQVAWIGVCLSGHETGRSNGNAREPIRDRYCDWKKVILA